MLQFRVNGFHFRQQVITRERSIAHLIRVIRVEWWISESAFVEATPLEGSFFLGLKLLYERLR